MAFCSCRFKIRTTNFKRHGLNGGEGYGKSKSKHRALQGVQTCVGVCPRKAIVPLTTVNKKGYEIIRVDEDLCIGCGMCYKMCPDYVFTVE